MSNDGEELDFLFSEKSKRLYLFISSMFMGGMMMLMFINENLYLMNIKYPYVAVCIFVLFFIIHSILDIEIKKE